MALQLHLFAAVAVSGETLGVVQLVEHVALANLFVHLGLPLDLSVDLGVTAGPEDPVAADTVVVKVGESLAVDQQIEDVEMEILVACLVVALVPYLFVAADLSVDFVVVHLEKPVVAA